MIKIMTAAESLQKPEFTDNFKYAKQEKSIIEQL